jgi:hypothetical protein
MKLFSLGSRSGAVSLPQLANVVIYAPLTSTLTASTGTTPTFTRSGASSYGATTTSLGTKTTDQALVPEFGLNETEAIGGMGIYGQAKNYCFYSQALDNAAWALIGDATVQTGASDPLGGTNAQSIVVPD